MYHLYGYMARAASRPAFWRLGAVVPPALSWSASVKIAASGASVCRRASVSGERNLVDRTALLGPGGPFVVGGVHLAGRGYHQQARSLLPRSRSDDI